LPFGSPKNLRAGTRNPTLVIISAKSREREGSNSVEDTCQSIRKIESYQDKQDTKDNEVCLPKSRGEYFLKNDQRNTTHPMMGLMNAPAPPFTPMGYSFGQIARTTKIVSAKESNGNGIFFIKNACNCQAKNSGFRKYLKARSFSQCIVFFRNRD
jgi:hypothetical protein